MGARVHDVRDVNGIPSFFQVSWHFVTVVCVFHCLLIWSNIFSASLSLSEIACETGVVEIIKSYSDLVCYLYDFLPRVVSDSKNGNSNLYKKIKGSLYDR